jgi:dUTP pyrophosphatase
MDEIEIPTVASDPECLPNYASELAAGADVKASIPDPVVIESGACKLIPTGLRFAIPQGYEIQVRPRSGLALKSQITVLNTPGTIDADYRGEVGVILINHGKSSFTVTPGMRIAQIVVAKVERAKFALEESLVSTSRGEGGFGHTGTH